MTDAVNLKPCPFCGEAPEKIVDATKILGVYRIVHRCRVIAPFAIEEATSDRALEKWNTRAEPAPAPDAVKIEPVGYVTPLTKHLMTNGNKGWSHRFVLEAPTAEATIPLYGPDAMDLIKELEELEADWSKHNASASDVIIKLRAEIEQLKAWKAEKMKALEPFGAFIEVFESVNPDLPDDYAVMSFTTELRKKATKVTIGDFRRALTGGQKDG